jgi:hypothetical protein
MADESKTETPITEEEFHTATGRDSRINRIAEEAAEKASKTEHKYDQNQDIFTK